MQLMNTATTLAAFLEKNPGKRHELVSFIQAGDARVPDWLKGKGPVGLFLIRLRVYLTEHGMKPSEWSSLDNRLIDLCRLIAHGRISVESAAEDIDTVKDNLFGVLLGKRGLSEEKLANVVALLELHNAGDLPTIAPQTIVSSVVNTPQVSARGVRFDFDQKTAFETFASLLEVIAPIAGYLASDACTPSDRKALRHHRDGRTGKTLFYVSTSLLCLTSETSREQMARR